MITTTFSGNKAIEINGKRFKPGASYTFTETEWDNFYEKSFFKVYEAEQIKETKKSKPKEKDE